MKFNEAKLKQIIAEETKAELKELHEQQILNEGIFGMMWDVLTGLPGGVLQNIKEWMAGKVLGMLGVEKEGTFFKLAQNFFGNLTMEDMSNIMSGEAQCVALTSELAGMFTETVAESIPETLGLDSTGWLAGAFRESLGEELLKNLNISIAQSLCDLNFSSLFSGGDDETEELDESKRKIHEKLMGYSKLQEELNEAWAGDRKIKQTGQWAGKSKEELCTRRQTLKGKEKRTAEETEKLRQINFAIRSKQEGPKFGKVGC